MIQIPTATSVEEVNERSAKMKVVAPARSDSLAE